VGPASFDATAAEDEADGRGNSRRRGAAGNRAALLDDPLGGAPGSGGRVARSARGLLRACARRPADCVGALLLLATAAAIIVNALSLQRGSRSAPITRTQAQIATAPETTGSFIAIPRPRPADLQPVGKEPAPVARPRPQPAAEATAGNRSAAAPRLPEPRVFAPRSASDVDARRLAALQRALADFGYGQIKPTGVADDATCTAIEKFERERKLPITGQASERVLREIAAATGRPL